MLRLFENYADSRSVVKWRQEGRWASKSHDLVGDVVPNAYCLPAMVSRWCFKILKKRGGVDWMSRHQRYGKESMLNHSINISHSSIAPDAFGV